MNGTERTAPNLSDHIKTSHQFLLTNVNVMRDDENADGAEGGALQKLWLEIGRFAIALSANQNSISEITKIQYFVPAFGISRMTSPHCSTCCTGSTCAADTGQIMAGKSFHCWI